MRSLIESLNDHPVALLRAIADLREIEPASNSRAQLAAQLAAALADPEATAAALARCSPAARAAWEALAAAGGHFKAAAFARAHGEIRPVGPNKLAREAIWREPANPAEELWYRGLIFRAFAELGEGPMEYIYIPEDGLAATQAARLSPPADAGPTPVPAPSRAVRSHNALAVDACTLLAMLREAPLQLDKHGSLRAQAADPLRDRLLVQDPIRFELLLTVMRDAGWLALDRGRVVVNHQAARAWLRGAHWEQMSSLFRTWRDSIEWNDLRRLPALRAEGSWRNDPLLGRAALLQALQALDPGQWYSIADLVAHVKAHDPDFQRPDGDYSGWYLRDAGSGRYLTGFEAWDEVEGRLIRFMIEGPLFWLGGVAIGKEGDPAAAVEAGPIFRLTPSGAAWLTRSAPAVLPRPARLSLDEDFVVTAPLLCPLTDRFRLLRFTEPMAPSPAEGGEAVAAPAPGHTRHRITRGSLARARASGIKIDGVLAFLRRASGGRVPARVAAAVARYEKLGGRVHVTRGAVLRVADASALAALRADPTVARLLGDLISAQAVVVSERNLPALLVALQESGYDVNLE